MFDMRRVHYWGVVVCVWLACEASASAGSINDAPIALIGAGEKVCQLTGDADWATGAPTAARTMTNFGLAATDLGYPVEHNGRLFLLFGDTWPAPRPAQPGQDAPDDAVGVVDRLELPTPEACLGLRININPGTKSFAPATIEPKGSIRQGLFNVPSGGVSVGEGLFAFFWTNHCVRPNPLQPSPDDPLARPAPTQTCPETDAASSIGTSVLARSADAGHSFHVAAMMPIGFVYATAVNSLDLAGLPNDQRKGIYVFGAPRYRASLPYLALAPVESFANPPNWKFFIGRDAAGSPLWVSYDEWMRGAPGHGEGWNAAGSAEIVSVERPEGRCIGEFSVTWNAPLRAWLMLYQCHGQVWARQASAPWGPWSRPTSLLDARQQMCSLLMAPDGCGGRRDFWPNDHREGRFMAGGLYAPYVLNRYTRAAEGIAQGATIYWLVSTWNPYQVVVMRSTLRLAEH